MMRTFIILLVAIALCSGRDFSIDYENDTFQLDGQPFQYISGSAHYFRMPRQYWRDRLRKLAAAGLNTVSTYVEWSQHQPDIGTFDFTGDLDIAEFVRTAEEEGLLVILRVGPYICAERDNGGFPYWLLHEKPDMRYRVNDEDFKKYLEAWLDVLLPYIKPMLIGNDGPIISVQVENEYGFYGACDHDYTSWLAGVFQRHIEDKAVLFTTDGSGALSCGKIPGVYATVDFGPGSNVNDIYADHKAVEPKGPFVNSEFYPGWLTHWGENWARRDTESVLTTLKEILDLKGSVNFYMFYGGSNLGFSAGANYAPYVSDVTSYDYDAPISEAGDLTSKYLAIRDLLLAYWGKETELPSNATIGNYGSLILRKVSKLNFLTPWMVPSVWYANYPLSFEYMSYDKGYALYSTKSLISATDVQLSMDARDRATVYIQDKKVGVLSREKEETSLTVTVNKNDSINILVENLGRINFGDHNNDMKGLLGDVQLDGNTLGTWTMNPFYFAEHNIEGFIDSCVDKTCGTDGPGPAIYYGTFISNVTSDIVYDGENLVADSYLDVSKLGKGVVFVNGYNIGRYWSSRGPQYSLYVPGAWLRKAPEVNSVIWIEEESDDDQLDVPFSLVPIVGDPKPW